MTEKVVRKTTAKKVVRRTASKTVPARSAAKKPTPVVTAARKAPSRITPSSVTISRKSPKVLIVGVVLFSLVVGVSALIGFSDKGQLDVENAIRDRKQNATGAEQEALKSVPTEQSGNTAPNGGLVGMGQGEQEPAPQMATSTESNASTSSSSATTTEDVQTDEAIPPAQEQAETATDAEPI